MTNPRFGDQKASMFICGDDAAAKRTVASLAKSLRFEPVDVGPLNQARLLERQAMLWVSMAYAYGHGPNIAFKLLLRRGAALQVAPDTA
jgi:predicted dinucleotide-binding enzyme